MDQRKPWIYQAQPFQPQRVPPFLGNKENISMDYSLATVVRTAESYEHWNFLGIFRKQSTGFSFTRKGQRSYNILPQIRPIFQDGSLRFIPFHPAPSSSFVVLDSNRRNHAKCLSDGSDPGGSVEALCKVGRCASFC